MKKLFFVLLLSLGLVACDKDSVYDNAVITNGENSTLSVIKYGYSSTSSTFVQYSPLSGTYNAKRLHVGTAVKEGDVLCTIETDKFEAEIVCEKSGILVEILFNIGDPVEIGQPLFVIEY